MFKGKGNCSLIVSDVICFIRSKCCDDSWCENCDGVRSCGQLVKRCLDGDGCATICEINAIWIPETQELMLNPN